MVSHVNNTCIVAGSFPEGVNGGSYGYPGGVGVHSTTMDAHPGGPHSQPHSTAHSIPENANHLPKADSSEVH